MAASSLGWRCLLTRPTLSTRLCLAKCLRTRPIQCGSPTGRKWYSEGTFNEPASGYKYSKSHEYASVGGSSTTVGISSHAQEQLGDIVFVELPEIGKDIQQGDMLGVLESVKAAGDIFAPVGGTVLEVNADLSDKPELVNTDCYEKGWLLKLKDTPQEDLDKLMSTEEYKKFLEEEA